MNDAETASPMREITSLGDLFAAFQLNKSSSLGKLLSAADLRSNIINWEEEWKENKLMKIRVAKIYKFFIWKKKLFWSLDQQHKCRLLNELL